MTPEEREQQKKSRELEKRLKKDFEKQELVLKLLLLGAGESGKSTIFKQLEYMMKGKDYQRSPDEIAHSTNLVYDNVITAVQAVIAQAREWGMDGEMDGAALEAIDMANAGNAIDTKLAGHVKTLWDDPGFQKVWDRRAEFQVVESMKYFFDKILEIGEPGYKASNDDHLYTRVKTTGVVTKPFTMNDANFEIYDVGGQRNERKKWIHVFDNVTAVIFVAAVSEYDSFLVEDSTQNRMMEALDLFGEVCELEVFQECSMILFLNKSDLFEEKYDKSPISDVEYFKDYVGQSTDDGFEYFRDKFLARNTIRGAPNDDRMVYWHITCATNTDQIDHVFGDVKDVILNANIAGSGF